MNVLQTSAKCDVWATRLKLKERPHSRNPQAKNHGGIGHVSNPGSTDLEAEVAAPISTQSLKGEFVNISRKMLNMSILLFLRQVVFFK
ncbi:hypothetical protein [Schlesneria paludicola]|uniref:hypothetical protein n=1 Tax=Schlesneria paludicola TaxID=360056 RepID=UPI00029A6B4D|nr:hypothetical protein [Schlesneria paludicola]